MKNSTKNLFSLIRSNELTPGELIPSERELMARLDMSRSSIREAIRELYAWNILDIKHGKGVFLSEKSLSVLAPALIFYTTNGPADFCKQRLVNLVQIRKTIESGFVEEVRSSLTGDQVGRLRKICEKMENGGDMAYLDRLFHKTLYQNIGNPLVDDLLELFWIAYRQSESYLFGIGKTDEEVSIHQHSQLLDAYRYRGKEEIEYEISRHYDQLIARISGG